MCVVGVHLHANNIYIISSLFIKSPDNCVIHCGTFGHAHVTFFTSRSVEVS